MTPTGPVVRRVLLGYFRRPGTETDDGSPRIEAVMGYVVKAPGLTLLFDTGLGACDAETEAHYRPHRIPLHTALRHVETTPDDIDLIVNCHLHFDHCGGNPSLTAPIVVQRVELEAAQAPGFTVPELVELPDGRYREVDGDCELAPDVHLIATPGHTPGHQSLAVRLADGTVVLAGQVTDTATQYTAAQLSFRSQHDGYPHALPISSAVQRLAALNPRRVLFAHDLSVWESP